jgi:hypothetical protein
VGEDGLIKLHRYTLRLAQKYPSRRLSNVIVSESPIDIWKREVKYQVHDFHPLWYKQQDFHCRDKFLQSSLNWSSFECVNQTRTFHTNNNSMKDHTTAYHHQTVSCSPVQDRSATHIGHCCTSKTVSVCELHRCRDFLLKIGVLKWITRNKKLRINKNYNASQTKTTDFDPKDCWTKRKRKEQKKEIRIWLEIENQIKFYKIWNCCRETSASSVPPFHQPNFDTNQIEPKTPKCQMKATK